MRSSLLISWVTQEATKGAYTKDNMTAKRDKNLKQTFTDPSCQYGLVEPNHLSKDMNVQQQTARGVV